MIRGGIPKCFECAKLATVKCYECLNEFEEPKTFCFICDNSIHKGLERAHQKETISFNQQLDQMNNQQPQFSAGQNYNNYQERRVPSRTYEQRTDLQNNDYRQNNQLQLQQDNPKENLQFFRDLKYTSNHQSVRNNISEDRFKNAVAGPFYSNRNQGNQNYQNNFTRQSNQTEGGRTFQHYSGIQQPSHQHNISLQNEPRFTEEFEQRYQHKMNVKKYQRNQFVDNQLLTHTQENHDSFLSNEEDRAKPSSNPLQQGLSDEEGETKGIIQTKVGQTLLNRNSYQRQMNEKQQFEENNLNTNNTYHKSSEQFKQQLEQEISDLKKYQNIHHNKYKSALLNNYDKPVQKEEEPRREEVLEQQIKEKSAEEEYKSVKNDLTQYFGSKELDDRENEVLKRISEIKKKIQSPQSQQGNNFENERGNNRLINNYRDSSDKQEVQIREPQAIPKTSQTKHQRLNSNNDRREQDQTLEQVGSAKKYKNDFENLIGQVGPNEEKSYIEGLKNIYQNEIKNLEIKHKIKVQELENSINYMRQHMDLMEERNKDNIVLIQNDLLKQQKIVVEQERDSKYGLNEMRLQYQEEINHLQLQVETERAKNIQLEKKMNDYQLHYQHKLREMADNTKKAKLETEAQRVKLQEYIDEMEEKIEDMRARMVQENEIALQKIKIDYESSIEDFKDQIKEKSEQIAKLEKQLVEDSQAHHEREREIKKEGQEFERQFNQMKNEIGRIKENTQQFKTIATEQENELELARRENELLEEQKLKLEEEKTKLEEQVEKYQKYIYGDKKEKSVLMQLKGSSSRPSLSRASSTSLKSTSSKNNKKKEN